jgi:hypothetical protein
MSRDLTSLPYATLGWISLELLEKKAKAKEQIQVTLDYVEKKQNDKVNNISQDEDYTTGSSEMMDKSISNVESKLIQG